MSTKTKFNETTGTVKIVATECTVGSKKDYKTRGVVSINVSGGALPSERPAWKEDTREFKVQRRIDLGVYKEAIRRLLPGLDDESEIHFNLYAGCSSCPCSPGFEVKNPPEYMQGRWVWLKLEIAEAEGFDASDEIVKNYDDNQNVVPSITEAIRIELA